LDDTIYEKTLFINNKKHKHNQIYNQNFNKDIMNIDYGLIVVLFFPVTLIIHDIYVKRKVDFHVIKQKLFKIAISERPNTSELLETLCELKSSIFFNDLMNESYELLFESILQNKYEKNLLINLCRCLNEYELC